MVASVFWLIAFVQTKLGPATSKFGKIQAWLFVPDLGSETINLLFLAVLQMFMHYSLAEKNKLLKLFRLEGLLYPVLSVITRHGYEQYGRGGWHITHQICYHTYFLYVVWTVIVMPATSSTLQIPMSGESRKAVYRSNHVCHIPDSCNLRP